MICKKILFTTLKDHQVSVTSEEDSETLFLPFSHSKIVRYCSHSNSQALWDLLSPATQVSQSSWAWNYCTFQNCQKEVLGFRDMLLSYAWEQKGINVDSTYHLETSGGTNCNKIHHWKLIIIKKQNKKKPDGNKINKTNNNKTRSFTFRWCIFCRLIDTFWIAQ